MKLDAHIKIWLTSANGQNVIGNGRCRLLQAIEEHGSLSAAAEHLDISYRKAWGDLKKAEKSIGQKLINKTRGGSGGGKTELTPEGARLLRAYTQFVEDVKHYVDESYNKHVRGKIND